MTPEALATILGMALVTYLTRIGGYWLIGRLTLSPRLEAALAALPGTILIALLAPMVLAQGLTEALAGAVVVLAVWRTGNLIVAIVVGVAAAALLRQVL